MKYRIPGLKLGGTSFMVLENYVPAVRFSAEVCDDIALLLLEPGEQGEYLPSVADVREIARIAEGEGVSFNVHLPASADFDKKNERLSLINKIQRVIDRVGELSPHSWVLHVEYPELSMLDCYPSDESRERTALALEQIAAFLPSPEMLALENLETFPTDFIDYWLEGTPYSRCFDIGHVWKDGHKPELLWEKWHSRIRMCHLHGLAERDHRSLIHMSHECLDAIMFPIWESKFSGAVTLEVFKFDDFRTSHQALLASYERYGEYSRRQK